MSSLGVFVSVIGYMLTPLCVVIACYALAESLTHFRHFNDSVVTFISE